MRYCLIVFAFVISSCFGNNVLTDKSVIVRVTKAENAVTAKRKAIRDAYIKVAKSILEEKGLNINDVSTALDQEMTDEKILEIFSKFIESFSISEEKIAFDDYQAKFNFKIIENKFSAWAFSIVNIIMKKANSGMLQKAPTDDIYAKEVKADGDYVGFKTNDDVEVELKNNTQINNSNDMKNNIADDNINSDNISNDMSNSLNQSSNGEVTVECRFASSFTEWMYFFKDKVDRVFNDYKIINFDDSRIKLSITATEDDLNKYSEMFEKEEINFFKKDDNIWVIEQKV